MSFDDLFTPEAAEQRRIGNEIDAAEARVVEAALEWRQAHHWLMNGGGLLSNVRLESAAARFDEATDALLALREKEEKK